MALPCLQEPSKAQESQPVRSRRVSLEVAQLGAWVLSWKFCQDLHHLLVAVGRAQLAHWAPKLALSNQRVSSLTCLQMRPPQEIRYWFPSMKMAFFDCRKTDSWLVSVWHCYMDYGIENHARCGLKALCEDLSTMIISLLDIESCFDWLMSNWVLDIFSFCCSLWTVDDSIDWFCSWSILSFFVLKLSRMNISLLGCEFCCVFDQLVDEKIHALLW